MVRGNFQGVNPRQVRVDLPSGRRVKKGKRADPRYVALRLLAVRPRSIQELASRLRQKGFSETLAETVVRELIEQGLLDDAQFARILIEQTVARKPAGRKLLVWKLRKARVAPNIAEEALSKVIPQSQELLLARAAASRKLKELTRRRSTTRGARLPGEMPSASGAPSTGRPAPNAVPGRRPDASRRDIEARLGRFLLSRGFSSEVIRQVLNTS